MTNTNTNTKTNTLDMTFTHNGSIFTLVAEAAPLDKNGNKRTDIQVIKDGKTYYEPVKGYRRHKQKYRTQLGSHEYSHATAITDLFNAIVGEQPSTEPSITSNGTKRSTHSEVTQQIQEHIIECLSEDETTDLKEQLQNVADAFNNWYGPYEKKRIPNRQAAFIDWLHGLPSELSVEIYYHNQREILSTWMGVPYNMCSDQKVDKTYHYLIFREISKLFRMHDIKF